jgi:transposase
MDLEGQVAAPAPKPIPEDMVTAGFLARLLVEKYVLGRPALRIIAGVVVRRLPGGRGDFGRGAGGGLGPAGPLEAAIRARNAASEGGA